MYIMFYIIFFVFFLLGIVLMVYSGKLWSFFGFNVFFFVILNSEIKVLIKNIYEIWVNIGYFLIVVYVGVVFFYYYIQKDNILL